MQLNAATRTIRHDTGRVETFPTLAAVMAAWTKYHNEARGRQDGDRKQNRRDELDQAGVYQRRERVKEAW